MTRAGQQNHLLTFDVGTSATRVSAVSPSGSVLASAAAPGQAHLAGIQAVLDVDALWDDLCKLTREVVHRAGQPLALGVAAQLGTVLVDEAMAPVVPALLWQDRRASEEAVELAEALNGRDGAIAGRPATAELTAPRLLWLARHQPESWARTRWVLSLKDFVVARLTGSVATDPTSASYTLLFDVRRGTWSSDLTEAAAVPIERLPPVVPAYEAGGTVAAAAAQSTGVKHGLPVAVGGPDGTVGALGSGAGSAGHTIDVAGTTDVLLRTTSRPIDDPARKSILNAYLTPGLWSVGGPTGMTGGAIAWLCGVLGYESVEAAYRELGSAVARVAPGADGVVCQTALTGERFPTWSGGRTGSLSGLRPEHTPAHLLRAAEEGAAFTVRDGLEALAGLGLESKEVRVSGGVTRRPETLQLRANAWGRPVVCVSTLEATTVGAAILAAVCCDIHGAIDDAVVSMVDVDSVVDPDPSVSAAFDQAYGRWQAARQVAA